MNVQDGIRRAIEELEGIIAKRAPTAPLKAIQELRRAVDAVAAFGERYEAWRLEKSAQRPPSDPAGR